jgi:predicted Zn-dependent peptidase
MFKGTQKKKSSAINSYLDRLGGELNAYTTKEEIVIHATVLKEDLSKASGLLMELATQATFPDDEVKTERGVIIDEIISYKDSPADDVYDRFEEALFKGHPLGRAILGTAASVRKITPAQLRKFVAERFIPTSMAFTIVADIDEKKLEASIHRLSSKFFPVTPAPVIPKPVILGRHAEDLKNGPFNIIEDKKNHEANVVLGALAPSLYDTKDRMTAILLANLLGGPASNSMLGSALREKNGWVYSVECSYTPYADTGIFAISFGCDRPNLDRCSATITRILNKLMAEPLSSRRLAAARKQLLGQIAISSDNGEAECLSMGKSLLSWGRISTPEEIRTSISAITPDDLLTLSRRLFAPSSLSRLIFL